MPDLDLIVRRNRGDAGVRKADSAALWRVDEDRNQSWWFAADLLQKQQTPLPDSLMHPDSGIVSLSIALGHDASGFDLDGPLPEIPERNASKSGRERVIE